jgi:ribonuclease E
MKKEMLINALLPEETRIAIIENGVLEELYIERFSNENIVGNIYKGRIVNIEPSIQAVFVDFGIGRNGFLHISDVDPSHWGEEGGVLEQVRPRRGGRDAAPRERERPAARAREDHEALPADEREFQPDAADFLEDVEGADPFAPRDAADKSERGGRQERPRGRGRERNGPRREERPRESAPPARGRGQSPSRESGAERGGGQGRGRSQRGGDDRGRGRDRDRDRRSGGERGRGRGQERGRRPHGSESMRSSPPPPPQSELPELEDFDIEADEELRDDRAPVERPEETRRLEPAPPSPPPVDESADEDDFGAGLFDDSDDDPPPRNADAVYRRTPPDDGFGEGLFDGELEDDDEDDVIGEDGEKEPEEIASRSGEDLDDDDEVEALEDSEAEPAASPTQRYDDEDAFAGFADAELEDDSDEEELEEPGEPGPEVPAPQAEGDRPSGRRRRGRRGRRGRGDASSEGDRERRGDREPSPPSPPRDRRDDDPGDFDFDDEFAEAPEGRREGLREARRDERGGAQRRGGDSRRGSGGNRRPPGQRWTDPRRPRERPPIQEVFKRGQEVVVQVIKEGVGNKGPTLSTYISIPGRCLVAMPGLSRVGVSRKIVDPEQRRRLRDIVSRLDRPPGVGFIVRTAGMDRTEEELERDLGYLSKLWEVVLRRLKNQSGPGVVYQETDVIIRTIRDIFNQNIDAVYIDEKGAYERAREFMKMVMPEFVERIRLYDDRLPMFNKFHIEEEIVRIQHKTVPLERGGSIVIEQTEALVAIDVNSGSFRAEGDAEETAFQMNMAAAREIARQLRLRDLGGVIVNDFIDMREERHRRAVENCLRDAVRRDRARTKILRMSAFGLIEMTRQRIRPSLKRSLYRECQTCAGSGHVKTVESMAIDCMRLLSYLGQSGRCRAIHLAVDFPVEEFIQNHKRKALAEIEDRWRLTLNITGKAMTSPEEIDVHCYDARGDELDIDVAHLMTRS